MKNIHIEHLHFHIGEKAILHDITADLPADRFVALLGPNGCGKSTLLKHLYRVHRIQEGQILMDGTPITEIPLRAAAQEIGVMGQFHSVDFDFTVEEIALMGRAPYKESFEEDTAADFALVRTALERVGMAGTAQRSFNELSGGEQQRVMLARCLVQEPQLLILDEPTNGLDPAGTEEVRRLLVELSDEGVTVMVSSHLLDEIDRMASTLGILSAGRLVFQGTRAELMERSVPDVLVVTPTPQAVLNPQILAGLVPAQAPGASGQPSGPALVPQGVRIPGMSKEAVAELINRLVTAGVELHEVRREAQSLEDVFMDLTGRGGVL